MRDHDSDRDCATFLTDIAEELPVEEFEIYAADVGPYLPPDVLKLLREVEHLLADARRDLRGAGERLGSESVAVAAVAAIAPGGKEASHARRLRN